MLPAKFGSIWPSSFRGEDFFNISQSETRIALGGHICWRNVQHLVWFSNILALSVPDEGYSRNASCTLNLISMILVLIYYIILENNVI
jgi:hypothetical protein